MLSHELFHRLQVDTGIAATPRSGAGRTPELAPGRSVVKAPREGDFAVLRN